MSIIASSGLGGEVSRYLDPLKSPYSMICASGTAAGILSAMSKDGWVLGFLPVVPILVICMLGTLRNRANHLDIEYGNEFRLARALGLSIAILAIGICIKEVFYLEQFIGIGDFIKNTLSINLVFLYMYVPCLIQVSILLSLYLVHLDESVIEKTSDEIERNLLTVIHPGVLQLSLTSSVLISGCLFVSILLVRKSGDVYAFEPTWENLWSADDARPLIYLFVWLMACWCVVISGWVRIYLTLSRVNMPIAVRFGSSDD